MAHQRYLQSRILKLSQVAVTEQCCQWAEISAAEHKWGREQFLKIANRIFS
jgi:hypothetical protein